MTRPMAIDATRLPRGEVELRALNARAKLSTTSSSSGTGSDGHFKDGVLELTEDEFHENFDDTTSIPGS